MSPAVTVNTEPDPPREVAHEAAGAATSGPAGFLESLLRRHLDAVALAIVAAGFALRIEAASRNYFNPDELLHYLMIHQASLFLAYKASLNNAHPPLLYVVLYFSHFLSNSELVLRLPSVIAGTALCWVLYKWIGMMLGESAGLIGLIIVAFCPALVALSAEVREYALLLFFMTAALYFLERAFQEQSVWKMWEFSIFLYLAILSHYSAVFFALAAGIYALARISDSKLPRKVLMAWAGGQAGALAIYGFLYVTHVSKLKNSIEKWGLGYDQFYFRPDGESIFTFTRINTSNIFLYLFDERYVARAILLCFILGVTFLLFKELISRTDPLIPRHLGILLLLPFLAIWGAAIAKIYPYVGSRHTVFLAPFAIAASSYVLAIVSARKLWAGILIAGLLMGFSNAYGNPIEPGIARADDNKELMSAAMNYLHQTVSPGDVILADFESGVALAYYLCGPKGTIPADAYQGNQDRYDCAGYSLITLSVWKLLPQYLEPQFKKIAHDYDLKPGDRVWVFQAGWGDNFDRMLPNSMPQFRCVRSKSFGANIAITPFIVSPDFSLVSPLQTC